MTAKKIGALMFSAIVFVFAFTSCKITQSSNNTHTTTGAIQENTTALPAGVSVSATEGSTSMQEETTEDDFEFTPEEAVLLGDMDSDIYGKLFIYYQDSHIAILNEYDAVLFSFDAQNFAPAEETVTADGEVETIQSDDMDFDGYNDLRILYRQTALNSFFLCWMWDMETKSYVYYEPLADIPSPTFDKTSGSVFSLNRSSSKSAILTTYTWQDGELYPINHKTVASDGELVVGPEDVDTGIAITDGLPLSVVSLYGNKDSVSRWICKIEDERYVKLYEDEYNADDCTYRFVFRGLAQGTTTVVMRYATGWNADYIAEKILNVTVNPDATLSIVEIR